MLGCSGAEIDLSVKSAIWLPANDSLERTPRSCSPRLWKLGKRVCRGGKKRPEGIRGSCRAPPYGAGQHGQRSNRAVSRHTKRAPAENRRTAMKKGQPKLAVVDRRFTMGLKEKRQ